jgi:hypothetical protein
MTIPKNAGIRGTTKLPAAGIITLVRNWLVTYMNIELVPNRFLEIVTERAMSSIRISNKPYPQFYFLEALCILRFAARIDDPFKTEIINRINADIFEIIETDQIKWATTYSAKPFFFAHAPKSPIFDSIKDHVIRSLEKEISTQSNDGNFILNWSVQDEETSRTWKSIWTLDALRALHHHDMIASISTNDKN